MNKETIKSRSFRAYADPESKVLKVYNREAMDTFLSTLSGEVEFHITEIDNRTHWQNNYYWKVVLGKIIEDEQFAGYTKDEMHEEMKKKFKVLSTKLLTVAEFSEYLELIVRWASEWGDIRIPAPYDE